MIMKIHTEMTTETMTMRRMILTIIRISWLTMSIVTKMIHLIARKRTATCLTMLIPTQATRRVIMLKKRKILTSLQTTNISWTLPAGKRKSRHSNDTFVRRLQRGKGAPRRNVKSAVLAKTTKGVAVKRLVEIMNFEGNEKSKNSVIAKTTRVVTNMSRRDLESFAKRGRSRSSASEKKGREWKRSIERESERQESAGIKRSVKKQSKGTNSESVIFETRKSVSSRQEKIRST